MNLTIDDQHVYRLDGNVVPGVNEILQDCGLVNTQYIKPVYAERGKALHKACHLLDLGELDWSSVPEEYLPFIENYIAWKQQTGAKILESEVMLYHSILGFAGTLDKIVDIDGEIGVVDLKFGQHMKHYPLQLTAYGYLLMDYKGLEEKPPIACIHLKDGIKVREHEYSTVFDACLKLWRFKNG